MCSHREPDHIHGDHGWAAGMTRAVVLWTCIAACGTPAPSPVRDPSLPPARGASEAGEATEAGAAELARGPAVPEADCADRASAEAILELVRRVAVAQGVSAEALGDCVLPAETCARAAPPEACALGLERTAVFWHLELHPRPLAGAPTWLEAHVDPAALGAPARLWISASTWGLTASGAVRLRGVEGHVSHGEGGPGVMIDDARVAATNATGAGVPIGVQGVEWLTSHHCGVPAEVDSQPRVLGLTANGHVITSLAPGDTDLVVAFDERVAWHSHCRRYAARITFTLADETVVVVSEWLVSQRLRTSPPH